MVHWPLLQIRWNAPDRSIHRILQALRIVAQADAFWMAANIVLWL